MLRRSFARHADPEPMREASRSRHAMKRFGRAEEVAQAALYLASDASAFVSGTHLVVDGGITVGGRHSWDTTSPSPFALMFGEDSPFAAPAADPA